MSSKPALDSWNSDSNNNKCSCVAYCSRWPASHPSSYKWGTQEKNLLPGTTASHLDQHDDWTQCSFFKTSGHRWRSRTSDRERKRTMGLCDVVNSILHRPSNRDSRAGVTPVLSSLTPDTWKGKAPALGVCQVKRKTANVSGLHGERCFRTTQRWTN